MKRKRTDRSDWKRILEKGFFVKEVRTEFFKGYVTFIYLKRVSRPLWVMNNGKKICIADNGYVWIQHLPADAHYTQTAMFDAEGNPIQWYIDIIGNHGMGHDGVPWFDDLYLDIVINPDGKFELLDEDELEEALAEKKVSRSEYDLAWREARQLLHALEAGEFRLIALSKAHKKQFEEKIIHDSHS